MIRGTVSLPARHRQGRARRGVRRRATRPARPRRPGADVVGADDLVAQIERRLPRLRRRHRHARPDGPGRQARPHARAARPDAEPEDRHRHQRRRQDRRRVQGAARSSTAPTATATCTCRSARRASTPSALLENYHAVLDEMLRAKPASAKGRYLKGVTHVVDDGPGRARSTPRSPASRSSAVARGARSTLSASTTAICHRPPVSLEVMERRSTGRARRTRRSRSDGTSRVSAASRSSSDFVREAAQHGETREGRGRRRDPHQARRRPTPRCSPSTAGSPCTSWPTCAASLRPTGTEYKVFKNTLARRAVEGRGLDEHRRRCSRARWRSRSCAATPRPRPRRCATSARTTRRWS